MIEVIIKGKRTLAEKSTCLNNINQYINETLSYAAPDVRRIISALDKLGQFTATDNTFLVSELTELGYSKEEALQIKKDSLAVLSSNELFTKIKRELGGIPFELTRLNTRESQLEGWMPVGVLGHVTSSNDAMLPFFSSVEGILTGNINIIKTGAGAHKVAMSMIEKLCEIDSSLCQYFYLFPFSSKDEDLLKEMFALCNTVAVWGTDAATAGVRKLAPSGVKIVEWGNRISFAYFTKEGRTKEALKGLAEDICVNDQQACSAPQVVYYETSNKEELINFAEEFMEIFQAVSDTYPLHPMTQAEHAELTSQNQLCYLDEIMGQAKLLKGNGCRIYVRFDDELTASPLFRTIIIKPILRSNLISVLRPFRSYLQSVGLSCGITEIASLSALLLAGGANRITEPGAMMGGYTGEPHDGVRAMTQYLKRVSLINNKLPNGCMSLDEMKPMQEAPFTAETPLLKKNDFPEKREITSKGYLLLKSGGSSGNAKYAPHTYEDAEETYVETSRFMIAAGINPKEDICINLFYSGELYGGFISIYEALKHADVIQLPMTAVQNTSLVIEEIIANNVNVLLGMPTYLIKLFQEQADKIKAYGKIDAIYYGGEHFDPAQAELLKKEFSISKIRSLVYGCNEIGSMGYSCPYCEGSIHHIVSTKYLEILKLDKDEPVEPGEIGRLVWTPRDQENIEIKRYEIGDLGRFITEPCKCGRTAPRFELLGRFGDIFKFATNHINYKKIKAVFSDKLGYAGWLQILLSYDKIDTMTICVENSLRYSEEEALNILSSSYPEIAETTIDKTGKIFIKKQSQDSFILSSGGIKVINVVDNRIKRN